MADDEEEDVDIPQDNGEADDSEQEDRIRKAQAAAVQYQQYSGNINNNSHNKPVAISQQVIPEEDD